MHYKIKELHKLITILKNEEGLFDYGVLLLEGYAVGLETTVKHCSIPYDVKQGEKLFNRCSVCGRNDEERLTMTSMCGVSACPY